MSNPFNDRLDWALQGKYVRVHTSHRVYTGWVERVHHQRGSVILHDAEVQTRLADHELSDPEKVGSVFCRSPEQVVTLKPRKTIEYLDVDFVTDSPHYDAELEPTDYHMRRCYRNGFAGSFPVVRPVYEDEEPENYELINGHKRVEAMRRVGLDQHPFEVFECTDEQAEQLYQLAHREQEDEGTSIIDDALDEVEDDDGGD